MQIVIGVLCTILWLLYAGEEEACLPALDLEQPGLHP